MTPEQQIRQLRTHSDAYGATDIKAQEARVIALQALYELAGRHHKDHPYHSLYTGLMSNTRDAQKSAPATSGNS